MDHLTADLVDTDVSSLEQSPLINPAFGGLPPE